jgi:hypothetical protein
MMHSKYSKVFCDDGYWIVFLGGLEMLDSNSGENVTFL